MMRAEADRIPPDSLIRSVQDRRQYRRLRLPNGLHVILVQREPDLNHGDGDNTDNTSCSSQDSEARDNKPAALALGVTVGHFYDPPEFPGLAHLLEHMLFLDRAPNENSWEQFLSEHGGWSNATTSEETTLYFYEIHPDYLSESIEKFVTLFLLDPPLCAEAIDREVQAVESEFQEGLLVDEHRQTQVMCHLSTPGHPFKKFGWGNLKSLCGRASSTELANALRQFHSDFYRAENMNLVIMASDDLDQIEAQVVKQFGNVLSGSVPKLSSISLPFSLGPSDPRLVEVKSVKETYALELVFQLSCLHSKYLAQPCGYWGEILGDEGPGSAAQVLRERGLVSELKAGLSNEQTFQNSLFYLFTIHVTLTKSGYREWKEVLRVVFAYINACVTSGPQRHLWDQYASMASASFTWADPKEPAETVEELAYAMQRFSWDDVLSGPYLWRQYDPDLIMSIGLQLHPENVLLFMLAPMFEDSCADGFEPLKEQKPTGSCPLRVYIPGDTVCIKSFEHDAEVHSDVSSQSKANLPHLHDSSACSGSETQTEPWFGTEFRTRLLPSELLSSLVCARDPSLSLPTPSSLLPKSFSLVERNLPDLSSHPHVTFRNDYARVWHLIEQKHVTPRAHIALRLYTSACYLSPMAAVTSRLLIMLLEDALCTYLYEGEVSDLSISMRANRRGLEFQAEGFSSRLFEFVSHVIFTHPNSLHRIVIQPERFQLIKERLHIAWASAFYSPSDQVSYERLRILQLPKFTIESLRAALDAATLDSVNSTLQAVRTCSFVEVFLHGNVSVADACLFSETICESRTSKSSISTHTTPVVRVLPSGTISTWTRPSFNPLESNSAHVSYYQLGPDSISERAQLRFLQKISSENCFDCLRTRSQLGYSVSVHYVNTDGILGLAVEVISATHSVKACESAIESWIVDELYPLIKAMPDDTFDNHVEGFIMDIEAQDFSLGSKHDRLWDEITSHNYVFSRIEDEISIIEDIERKDVLALMDRLFKPETRSKLATHVVGLKSSASFEELVFNESLDVFKDLPHYSLKLDLS